MTTNQDRAAELLLEKDSEESFAVAINHDAFLRASEQRRADAQALTDAGLIAPDLPERDRAMFPPEGSVWYPHLRFAGDIRASANGEVVIMGIDTKRPDGTGDPYRIVGTADEIDTFARYLTAAAAAARTHREKQ